MHFHRIDHIAYAVETFEDTLPLLQQALNIQPTKVESIPEQKVDVAFFQTEHLSYEVIQPHPDHSQLIRFLNKRYSPCLHHVAFSVDDLPGAMRELTLLGYTFTSSRPLRGSFGRRICFLQPTGTNGVLIELCEPPNVKFQPLSAMMDKNQ